MVGQNGQSGNMVQAGRFDSPHTNGVSATPNQSFCDRARTSASGLLRHLVRGSYSVALGVKADMAPAP